MPAINSLELSAIVALGKELGITRRSILELISAAVVTVASAAKTPAIRASPLKPNKYLRMTSPSVKAST